MNRSEKLKNQRGGGKKKEEKHCSKTNQEKKRYFHAKLQIRIFITLRTYLPTIDISQRIKLVPFYHPFSQCKTPKEIHLSNAKGFLES